MIARKQKPCKENGHLAYLFSHGYCRYHWALKNNKEQKVKKEGKFEKDEKFFRWVWDRSDKKCAECGKVLSEFKRWWVHHLLPKAKFPYFRYEISNTIILCYQHHGEIESATSAPKMKVFEMCEKRKAEMLSSVGIDYAKK